MSIFEYDKEKEEKKLRKAERECGREEGREETLELISRMSAGGDSDKILRLKDREILREMKEKYGIEW